MYLYILSYFDINDNAVHAAVFIEETFFFPSVKIKERVCRKIVQYLTRPGAVYYPTFVAINAMR